ncbi:MAG: hypothetical protein SXV54_22670 [Chloroflexota bacterium]|nr:hypothetical protein [Chloroflexota bacterium]
MVLQFTDGRPFTTGVCSYWDQLSREGSETPRIIINIEIEGLQTQAAVDTGGVYLVCDPEMSDLLDLNPSTSLGVDTLNIRGSKYQGSLQRIMVKMSAEEGESLDLEVTAFIPRLVPGQEWRLPSFLGLQGCLEFLRIAIDPSVNAFHFGPL